jgi:hypothetical protein
MSIVRRLFAWYQRRYVRKWLSCERLGFDIYMNPLAEEPGRLQDRVIEALDYLRDRHPQALAQLRQDADRILVRPGGYSSYWASSRTCLLDQQLLAGAFPPYAIASFLVGAAAYARMPRLRLATPRPVREQVARRLIDEQLAIAGAEPGSERFVEWLSDYARHPEVTARDGFRRFITGVRIVLRS